MSLRSVMNSTAPPPVTTPHTSRWRCRPSRSSTSERKDGRAPPPASASARTSRQARRAEARAPQPPGGAMAAMVRRSLERRPSCSVQRGLSASTRPSSATSTMARGLRLMTVRRRISLSMSACSTRMRSLRSRQVVTMRSRPSSVAVRRNTSALNSWPSSRLSDCWWIALVPDGSSRARRRISSVGMRTSPSPAVSASRPARNRPCALSLAATTLPSAASCTRMASLARRKRLRWNSSRWRSRRASCHQMRPLRKAGASGIRWMLLIQPAVVSRSLRKIASMQALSASISVGHTETLRPRVLSARQMP